VAAVPLIGAVIAFFTGAHDRLDRRRTAGLLVGFAGVAALVGLDISVHNILSAAEVALVAVCYAVGPVIIARKLATLPAVGVVVFSLALSALIYAVPGVLQMPKDVPPAPVVGAVIGLAVICTALAFITFFALIAEVGPTRATVITYVNPAVALVLGVSLLREPLTLGAVIGFALILVGSVLANRKARERVPAQA
jgi:drug/metabolite transporter (DMT)-like permease